MGWQDTSRFRLSQIRKAVPTIAGYCTIYNDGILRIRAAGDPPQLIMAGEIDESTYPGLVKALEVTAAGQHEIHVHLNQVEYCDLAGLRAIVRLCGPDPGGDGGARGVVLHGLPAHLMTILRILGWDVAAGLTIAPDTNESVSSGDVQSVGAAAGQATKAPGQLSGTDRA